MKISSVISSGLFVCILSGVLTFAYLHEFVQNGNCSINGELCPNTSLASNSRPGQERNLDDSGTSGSSREEIIPPIDRARERVTKKPFGIFVTPDSSPVQPERFRGYHTGTDFETFSEEVSTEVPISAICAGKVLEKRFAAGYGGVFVTDCEIDNEPVTVVYGHLSLESISLQVGDSVSAGEKIGRLGAGGTEETDKERKHLHLGIHKGKSIDILGYVPRKSDLSSWVDPCRFVCRP